MTIGLMRGTRTWLAGAVLLLCSSADPARAKGGFEVERWLDKPGVKLLAVEFYATWCAPCMAAVPKWKALHEKYRGEGLRLVVVSTQDPKGGCFRLDWSPDEVVCDEDGRVAQRFRVGDRLPAAFLWSWQGHLLAQNAQVEDVAAAVDRWMLGAPRVAVEAGEVAAGTGANAEQLVGLVRRELERTKKVVVIADAKERARLDRLRAESLKARYDERAQCEIGKDLSANALLTASLSKGERAKLKLGLLSVERGCQAAYAAVDWRSKDAEASVAEGVADLLGGLRRDVMWPGGAAGASSSTELEIREAKKDVAIEAGGEEVVVRFESDPEGATILEGAKVLCTMTPCSKTLSAGRHTISMQKERYQERREAIDVSAQNKKVAWKLEPDYGWLSVASEPAGLEVLVGGSVAGKTPLERHELAAGTYEIRVRGPCHYEWGKKGVVIVRGKERAERTALEPREGAVKATLQDGRGNDLEAEVWIDGKAAGTTPGKPIKVSVCAKEIELRSERGTWRGPLDVKEGATAAIAANLDPARSERAPAPEPARVTPPPGEGPAPVRPPLPLDSRVIGRSQRENEQRDASIEELRKLLATAPASHKAELTARLADLFLEKSKVDPSRAARFREEASKLYQRLLEDHPSYARLDDVLFTLAVFDHESGDRKRAAARAVTLIRRFPNSVHVPHVYFILGDSFFAAGDLQKACPLYDQATKFERSPVATFALYKLAWCDHLNGKRADALAKLTRAAAKAAPNSDLARAIQSDLSKLRSGGSLLIP